MTLGTIEEYFARLETLQYLLDWNVDEVSDEAIFEIFLVSIDADCSRYELNTVFVEAVSVGALRFQYRMKAFFYFCAARTFSYAGLINQGAFKFRGFDSYRIQIQYYQ